MFSVLVQSSSSFSDGVGSEVPEKAFRDLTTRMLTESYLITGHTSVPHPMQSPFVLRVQILHIFEMCLTWFDLC